jgi:hypothetical protein
MSQSTNSEGTPATASLDKAELRRRPLAADVSPEARQALVRVMEEAAEVIQAASKLLRFGWHSTSPLDPTRTTNWNLLEIEMKDLNRAMTDVRALQGRTRG